MKTPSPHCIRPDTLRWAIFLVVLGSASALAQGGLEAASGPGGTPVINQGHGVPVIEIVPPNASGLSHNQFSDYNVGNAGLVLNNATAPGQSQLAGALAANPQFQGQAASTILNEVISRNASLIEGPQEVFGHRADYLLANPNGITLNGGSFINTTRAGFLVGTPEIEQQQLKYLDTLGASGSLRVLGGGQSNRDGALDLIAPRIDTQGLLNAGTDLGITAGRNRIDRSTGDIVQHLPGTPSSIDASLFGAMQAGRIRVVSTAEGAGVRVQAPRVEATEGVQIQSAGNLQVSGTASSPALLHSAQGTLKLTASDDLTLAGVEAKAQHIEARAGKKLTLDAQALERVTRDTDNWNKQFLFVTRETYSRTTTTTDVQQQGTRLQADDSLALQSGGDLRMTAAQLQAGNGLSIDSGGNLEVLAGIDSQRVEEQIRHRKDLWRGDSDSDTYTQNAQGSTLDAGQMTLNAAGKLNVQGSSLHSRGDLAITASQANVATAQLQDRGTRRDYRGDLVSGAFFGDRKGNDSDGKRVAGSSITSDGALSISADTVTLKGSKVFGQQGATLYSQKGALAIEADRDTHTRTDHNRDSKLFGLIASEGNSTERKEQVLSSDVGSATNLRLASAEELRIQGSKVEAGQHLGIEAKGDLVVDSVQTVDESETRTQQRGFSGHARETQAAQGDKPGSRQYTAGLGYEVNTSTGQHRETHQVGSELKGASVSLGSGAQLHVNGSKVTATTGDLEANAQKIVLGATHDSQDTTRTDTQSGGSLAVSGGIDRLGSQFNGHHNRSDEHEQQTQVQHSELQAGGNLRLNSDTLVTEAARVKAGNTLDVTAKQIENRAVHDTYEHEKNRNDWSASLGASLEYRDLTRPIERLVLGQEAARFQQASPEDAMVAPSIGADMTVEHLKHLENQRRGFAQVSAFSGADVQVKADSLMDQGTRWQADTGTLQIQAQQHHMTAAANTEQRSEQRLNFAGDARVDTSSGKDVNVRIAGNGGSLAQQSTASTAVAGSLYGKQGIQVQLGSDGRYEGTRLDGGSGDVRIHSQGTLAFTQATDTAQQQSRQLEGNAWAKVGNRPGSTGIDGRGYLDHASQQRTQSTAQVGQIDSQGEVRLTSQGDLLLEGTRIGSREAPTGDITLHSGGLLQVKAANSTQQASGSSLGGGLELALKTGTSKGGAIGGHLSHGKQQEDVREAVDARFASNGKLSIGSTAREEVAVHVQGLQASAQQIALNAANGGIRLEASSNQDVRDNLQVTAGAGFNSSTGSLDTRGLHGRVKVDLDKRNNLTWNAGNLRADHISLNSRGNAELQGVSLEAGKIDGTIEGDLRVASLKDSVNTLSIKGDARLSHEKNPQGYVNAATSLAGPFGSKVSEKAGSALGKVDPGLSPTLRLDVSHAQRDTVGQQAVLKGSEGIALNVGGNAHLVGARLQSARGDVRLDAAAVTQETLNGSDYRRDVSVDASNSPVDLGTALADIAKGKGAAAGEAPLDLGLLRTSGHNRSEQWASSISGK
ncbi:hemagglutinin repeat-containing protein [Pseudomonas sp. S36]|uniref:hemagglutinin repeat-containing protein n=1 Tax=Pseudomonas sp. S36 TaxID=2767447 RepID=UPI001911C772|nr:hemagglutinin repeat-containing protein [Pseudomonas sp. S36]MBK4991700.1 filamentous hemagglutinin N-terminal domain-containing protein [Pseudomonas sp. S36]